MNSNHYQLVIVAASSALTACALLVSLDDLRGGDGATDGPTAQDAGADGAAVADGAGADAGTIYSALDDMSKWSTFDTTTVNAGAWLFAGAAFDGRYVYFAPYGYSTSPDGTDGIVTQYDTQGAAFDASSSWSTFNVTAVNAGASGFAGAAFDEHYVYFVPYTNNLDGGAGGDGIVAQYDSHASFTNSASWSTFNTQTVNLGARGFLGAAFDGRFLYFVPDTNGIVTRYNMQAPFKQATSWATFDTTTVNAGALGFQGAVFDAGGYLYLVPCFSTVAVRFNTVGNFSSNVNGDWVAFNLSAVSPKIGGFSGGAFDGRYVYFVPASNGIVWRFDTQSPSSFTSATSWSTFDTTTLNAGAKGFQGAAFDGRYVYFVPFNDGVFDGVLPRYDTEAGADAFTSASSWSVFDTTRVNPQANGYQGAAFDGRYLYLVPDNNGIVTRFDAKTPPALPTGYAHGSFF